MNTKVFGNLWGLLTACVLGQNQVEIQFLTDPLVAQTGTEVVFTVLTVSQVLSMRWEYKGQTLAQWTGGTSVINPVNQFLGRLTVSATQLRIGGSRLQDRGNYTVYVIPFATTGLDDNSKSAQLTVFDAVAGIGLIVPTVAVEGRNVSLRCSWTAGTEITVQWGKGGATVSPDARITISGDSLVIKPAQRSDAGDYSCTASNPISAQTASQSITVYYGPDTPVLTKDTPKDCVGGGDVLLGQTVRLTCISDSLPPALFTWQRDGQPVVSNQPDSGVLRIQTISSDESGQYVCTARNSITGAISEQGTDLAIVGTCLDGGEVAGIVIGCFLLIILLLILFILLWRRRSRGRRRRAQQVQKTNPEPRPLPPYPQAAAARVLGQGPQPVYLNTHVHNPDHLYISPQQDRSNPQALRNGRHSSNTQRHTDHPQSNGFLHTSIRNNPHNGIDNPAFTQADDHNIHTNVQQQNPNVLIQAGPAQPAVHVSLNTPPHTAQQNNAAQMPTIHVNLNSFAANGHQAQREGSIPFNSASSNNALQAQENVTHTELSNPRMPSGPSYQGDNRFNGHVEASQPGLIPTGYTHGGATLQRNANTQTYLQEPEPLRTSDRTPSRQNAPASSSPRQMPWDLLRGTPAYPGGTVRRGQASPENSSSTTDYTTHPPIREEQNRSVSQSEAAPRSRSPSRSGARSTERQPRSRSADLIPNARSATETVAADHTDRSPPTQQSIRGLITSMIASRHERTRSNSPQTRPRSSQQVSAGHSAVSQGHMSQQGLNAPWGGDTRALADPNHLPQTHTGPQRRAEPSQNPAQGQGTQTQPVANGARQPRQAGTAPGPAPASRANPSHLTQDALRAHSHRTQTFQSRRQQTQAALLHPGQQTQAPAPAVAAQRPPTPPPVIPLAQFQSLPKKRIQSRSPGRGAPPPRPPVNVPVAQRPRQPQRRNGHQHRGAVPGQMPHGAHRHAHGHGHGHRPTTHTTHPRQQQAHGGRMR